MKPNANDIFDGLESLNIIEIQRHIIRRLYEAGYGVRDMSKITGISERTLYRELAVMGIQTIGGKERKTKT